MDKYITNEMSGMLTIGRTTVLYPICLGKVGLFGDIPR